MLNPATVVLSGSGVELTAAAAFAVTPYVSPEQLQGSPAGTQSDIFSFGALVYELVTGHGAFEGDTPDTISQAILTGCPASTGHADLDRLIACCLEKNPAARWQRIQQVLIELRLMLASARRRESHVTIARKENDPTLRAGLRELEAAVAKRLEEHEKSVAASLKAAREEQGAAQQAACDALAQLRAELGGLGAHISAAEQRANRAEQTLDEAYREIMQAHGAVAADFGQLRETVAAQAQALESAKSTMAKTDDLVERVVEALDALQNMVLEQAEARAA